MTEDEILFDLPLARANLYLASLGRSNGARIVWAQSYTSDSEKLDELRTYLPDLLAMGFRLK